MSDETGQPTEGLNEQKSEGEKTSTAEKTRKTADFAKRAAKAIKSGAAKQSLIAALGPILLWAFVIIVIIIIIIGIAMFLVTMPGMVMDKLKALFKDAGNFIAAFFGADTTKQIDNVEIYSTLDYLEQMGWDLKSEGFVSDFVKSTAEADNDVDEENGINLDEKVGVLRDNDDKIITAKSDFIFTYMVSDNYVYTIKNHNLVTQKDSDNWLKKFFKGYVTAVYKYYNALFGPVFDFLGVTEAFADAWGRGLLAFYYDDGVGVQGRYVNTSTIWNWDSIEIDTDSKKLLIKRSELFNNNNAMEFSLDGWTGRYGMPLEFLLAVHKATMMPDLSYDMATTFNTNVNIYLHDISGEAITAYKTSSGYVDCPTLEEKTAQFKGQNWFSAFINWLDDLYVANDELAVAKDLGIDVVTDSCGCVYEEILFDADGRYKLEADGTYPEGAVDGDGNSIAGQPAANIQKVTTVTSACSDCKAKLDKIKDLLKKDYDHKFKAYSPYIANVKNHWYRDVYFVVNSSDSFNFVDYDYDYEIMTGERWTLYETDSDGNFVYYKVNEDGSTGEKYTGEVIEGNVDVVKSDNTSESMRIASMGENGEKVVKKAVTISSRDTDKLTDLGWNENTSDVWSAYEENESESETGFERLYPDEDIADDEDKEIKSKIYINVKTTGNIVQTGEGQRTETNKDIKKMFLQNNYFRYDGTDTTAEIILALREKLYSDKKDYYGALSAENVEKEVELDFSDAKYTSSAENGSYKVKDYVGNVTLNQDSLNAFSMLENTHTLDADYIYRDFKELIVELGYFQKEELTDETPKLLQWLIPDIASGGYPDKSIDKRENEFGTMVHSKSDIEANQKHTLAQLIAAAPENTEPPEGAGNEPNGDLGIIIKNNFNTLGKVATLEVNPIFKLDNVGAISNISDSSYTFKGSGSSAAATKTGDLDFNGVPYEVWKQTDSTCTLYAFAFMAQAYTGESPDNYLKTSSGSYINLTGTGQGGNEYWVQGAGVSWDMFDKVGISGQYYFPSDADVGTKVGEALGEGKPVYFYGDLKASAGYHAVVLLGAGDGGKVIYYNPGPGSVEAYGTSSDFASNLSSLLSNHFKHRIFIPDEAPKGVKKSGAAYEGYEGNDAVVSPVTGILLDYGTYEKTADGDIIPTQPDGEDGGENAPVTKDDPRVNVDLKYGFPNIYENNATDESGNGGNGANGGSDSKFESQIVSDKVGYAKILVLDAENYQKLESGTSNTWQSNSLVRIDQKTVTLNETDQATSKRVSFREALDGKKASRDDNYSDVYKDWSALDKTVYGYKEFAETYEKYGIAGYVVYIDGFKCELPDESLTASDTEGGDSESDDGGIAAQIPSGEALTIDSFRITDPESEDLIESKYEKDEDYKLASQKSTDKLAAENAMKKDAASSLAVNDLIFIKEGTIIGRTLTDKELLESPDFRNGEYGTYEELRGQDDSASGSNSDNEEEKDNRKLIGNYLRVMLQDAKGTMIENPENYMKLDELDGRKKLAGDTIEEKVWLALLEAGYSEIAAAGVMGNIYGESGFDPAAIEKSNGEGHGLCQWSYGRKQQLFDFAASRGVDWSDGDLQVEFLMAELTPGGGADGHANYQFAGFESYKSQWENATTIEDATTAFCAGFERPGNPRNEARIEAAKKYYEMFAGS